MKYQASLFFTALQFYTRIPIPKWVEYRPEDLSRATRYFPLMGWIVAFFAGVAWVCVSWLTDDAIGILFSMVASILTTGAFHEDGFADVCDGFGGGWTREKILLIMKDSRLGTYGSVGLILILALKFCLLRHILFLLGDQPFTFVLLLVSAHAISRFMAASVIFTQPYARDTQGSKAKPVAEAADVHTIIIAAFFGILPLIALACILKAWTIMFSPGFLGVITFLLSRYFAKWIGGYTGDCLGAVQQVCEISFYFFLAVLWKFI